MSLKKLMSFFSVEEEENELDKMVTKDNTPSTEDSASISGVRSNKKSNRNKSKVVALHGSVSTMNVRILEPAHYADSQEVAEFLMDNCSVVVNLHLLNEAQSRRVLDFLTGFIYAINGDVQRIGNDIFLCTPETVSITGEISAFDSEGKERDIGDIADEKW